MKKISRGFTLIELLVVIAIIGILTAVVGGSFRTSQMKGRDAQRKSDLKQVSSALEVYYSDYGKYPDTLTWQGEFTDGKTTYFREMPSDPSGLSYFYRVFEDGQKYQLYAYLENSNDKDIDSGIIALGYNCGRTCNFGISSTNTTPTE